MISILLAIIFPVVSVVLFKEFEKREINSLQAIVFNYFGAIVIGMILFITPDQLLEIGNQEWLYSSIVVGVLFLFDFYLISKSVSTNGVSVTTFANKISLVIPVVVAIVFLLEPLSSYSLIGIVLAICSIYLITKDDAKTNKTSFLYPALIFVFTGLLECLIIWTQKTQIHGETEVGYFTITSFTMAFMVGLILLLIQFKGIKWKNVIAGLILSIPNTLGVYFFIYSLNQSDVSSVILPVLHVGSLTLAVVIGYFVYSEKLTRINLIGVVLALLSIIILTY